MSWSRERGACIDTTDKSKVEHDALPQRCMHEETESDVWQQLAHPTRVPASTPGRKTDASCCGTTIRRIDWDNVNWISRDHMSFWIIVFY